jgi:hypothetical protein
MMAGMIQPWHDRFRRTRREAPAHGFARWWIVLLLLAVLGTAAAGRAIVAGGSGPAPVSATVISAHPDWIDPWSLAPDAAGRPDLPLVPDELARRLAEQQPRRGASDGEQLTDR